MEESTRAVDLSGVLSPNSESLNEGADATVTPLSFPDAGNDMSGGYDSGPIIVDSTEAENQVKDDSKFIADLKTKVDEIEETATKIKDINDANVAKDDAVQSAKDKGGMTAEEAKEIWGTDFTGLIYDDASGLYIPDSSASERRSEIATQKFLEGIAIANNDILGEVGDYSYYDERSDQVGEEYNALVESIKKSFEGKKRMMADSNKRSLAQMTQIGFRLGTSKFTPLTATGVISAEEKAGIARLADLDAQMNSLILEAQMAKSAEQFELLHEKRTKIEALQKEKREELKAQQQLLKDQSNALLEEQKRIEGENAVTELILQGITNPVAISQMLEGVVPFADVVAITDTYKDQEKMMQETINSALSSPLIGDDAFELISGASDLPFWQKEMIALDVLRGQAKDEYIWDRNMDEQTLNKMYFDMNMANKRWTFDLENRMEARKKTTETEYTKFKQDTAQAMSVFTLANELVVTDDNNYNNFIGMTSHINPTGITPGTKRWTFQQKVERLKNLLTLENLPLMSGVLSETDIKILERAGTMLDVALTEDAWDIELERILTTVRKAVQTGVEEDLITWEEYHLAKGKTYTEIADMRLAGLIPEQENVIEDESINKYFNY